MFKALLSPATRFFSAFCGSQPFLWRFLAHLISPATHFLAIPVPLSAEHLLLGVVIAQGILWVDPGAS